MPPKMMSHSREVIAQKRQYNRQLYCVIIRTIKQANIKGEKIGYRKLCELKLISPGYLNRFIREAEAWGMIEGSGVSTGYRWYSVTSVGDAFLDYCDSVNISNSET